MDNLADNRIRTTRTLFNIDDKQEDKYEDDEKDKIIKKGIQQTKEEKVNGCGKDDDPFDKKQGVNSDLDNEIELYLQVQVDSKFQQQLWTDVQNKDLKNQKPEIKIELKIEIPQEFDSSYVKNIDKEKQHFKEGLEKKSEKKISSEIKVDSGFQHGMERDIRLKQNLNKENVFVDLGGKNTNFLNTQDQIQKGIEIKSQEKAKSDVLLRHELQKQKNIHENIMESSNRSVQTRIERLICEIPSEEQKTEEELRQEIKELNKEINELDPVNVNELNKDILENVSKNNYFPAQVKYLKNLYCSFVQDLKPFYDRLDRLSNDNTQTTAQQKLNEEFLKKLDSLSQQKCNKENGEGHQQVDSKIIHIANQNVKVVEDNKKFKLKDELKTTVGLQVNHGIKNNGKIKEKESQQNNLRETQEGVNRDERIRNQFEEIDKKENCQHYDLVIQYNHEMSQELNGHAQQVLGKKMIVDFYDDAVKTFLNKSDKDALKKKLCKEGVDIIDQNPKEGSKNLQFQLEFYKNVQVEEELPKENKKQLQNYTEEEINGDFKVKTKENKTRVQEDSDVELEEFEKEMQEYSKIANNDNFKEVHKNSKFKIGALERAKIIESGVKIEDSENELQEESDVDIEGFEGEILEFPEVEIEDFDEESQESTDLDTKDFSEEGFNDKNEVTEIVEDIEVESYYSIDDNIPSDKIPTSTCNESNLKMDPNSKLTHDEEEKLKIINSSSDPTIFTEHNKEKQTFFEFKHILDELSQEYKCYAQQKAFTGLQQEIDDKQLQEMEIFPNMFNEININTGEDFKKEIDKLHNEWCQLIPEFMSDVPLSIEDDNSSKKIGEIADNKECPEKCFQPSSLLEILIDDRTEYKPHVLVIILHSIDKGYSIKINTDLKSPKEYYFNYYEDTILEHIESEHIPPDLMNLLARAEPSLFYSGCVIAEIHDQVDEIPGHVYKLILHPSNMHQGLSCRNVVLNPLKRKNNFLKPIPLKTDSYNESNDNLNTSMLSNEPQEGSLKLMDTENTNIDNYILWKFDFRIKSLNLFKMVIMVITETLEFSMLLCTNAKVDSIKKILRFKIQPQQNEFRNYIHIIQEILQQRIGSDINVVRRYYFEDNSTPCSLKSVPSLLNGNIYKASQKDISQLMDIFLNNNSHIKYIPINKKLENMCERNREITEFEIEKSDLSLMQDNLTDVTQNPSETKEILYSKVPDIKTSMLFCATKKLSINSSKFLDLSNLDLKDKIADSSSLKTTTIPKNILFFEDTSFESSSIFGLSTNDLKDKIANMSSLKPQTISKEMLFSDETIPLLKEKSTNTEINTTLEPLLIRPIYEVSESDDSSDQIQGKILPVSENDDEFPDL